MIALENWPGAISSSVIEGGCGEMSVNVICPKSCEFGDIHDSWSSESIFNRSTIRGGGGMMGGQRWMMAESLADEDAVEQGYELS